MELCGIGLRLFLEFAWVVERGRFGGLRKVVRVKRVVFYTEQPIEANDLA